MDKIYRIGSKIAYETAGEVVVMEVYKSINRAKRANRGNLTAATLKPKFAAGMEIKEVG